MRAGNHRKHWNIERHGGAGTAGEPRLLTTWCDVDLVDAIANSSYILHGSHRRTAVILVGDRDYIVGQRVELPGGQVRVLTAELGRCGERGSHALWLVAPATRAPAWPQQKWSPRE